MHLDAGEFDLTSLTHVPLVSVQSYVQSDGFSNYTRYAATVSPRSSSNSKKIASVRRHMALVLR